MWAAERSGGMHIKSSTLGMARDRESKGGGRETFSLFPLFIHYFTSCTKHMSFYNFQKWFNTENYTKEKRTRRQCSNKELAHFSSTKRKGLLTQNPTSLKNFHQEWKGNGDILRWRKLKRFCHHHTYPKRTARRTSPNRKKIIKGLLEYKEERTQ